MGDSENKHVPPMHDNCRCYILSKADSERIVNDMRTHTFAWLTGKQIKTKRDLQLAQIYLLSFIRSGRN